MIAAARRNTEVYLLALSTLVAGGGYWLVTLAQPDSGSAKALMYGLVFAASFTAAHASVRRFAPRGDGLLLPIAALLNAIGFVLIARLEGGRGAAPASAQVRWTVVAVIAFAVTLAVVRDARELARYRYTFAALGLVLLVLPTLPLLGREVNGARLWIQIGPLNFQPAELAKIALVLFFAGYLSEKREMLAVAVKRVGPMGLPSARHFGPVLVAWAVSLLVMVQQKDLGSSLLFFAAFVVMLWTATGRPAYLVVGMVLFVAGAFVTFQMFGHVRDRIEIWRDPFAHIDGRGFQLVQSMFALATGGTWGTGLGLGRPDLIPFVQTDFVFAALGEELGFAGTTAVLVAFALFTARGFGLAVRVRDDFSKLLVAGLITTFGLQTILIVGGVVGLIPLTGVTLPFVSYGGSSLLSNFVLTALLIRVSDTHAVDDMTGPPTMLDIPAGGGR